MTEPAVGSVAGEDSLRAIGTLSVPATSRLPLWFQVAETLRSYAGRHASDVPVRLPTEAALAHHLEVSVATVRQALAALEADGLVSRQRRRGTFVNPRDADTDHSLRVSGSIDAVVHQQASERVVVLGRTIEAPPGELAAHFTTSEVVCIRRLRFERGAPLSYAENYLHPDIAARVRDRRLRTAPMTQLLRDDLGLQLARIENVIEARTATPTLADLLEVELLSPILLSTNITRDVSGDVVDVAVISYRGDRFRFTVGIDLS